MRTLGTMVEMKARISWILSSRPAAIGSRMTVWATEIMTPSMQFSEKKSSTNESLRPAPCGSGSPLQCPG